MLKIHNEEHLRNFPLWARFSFRYIFKVSSLSWKYLPKTCTWNPSALLYTNYFNGAQNRNESTSLSRLFYAHFYHQVGQKRERRKKLAKIREKMKFEQTDRHFVSIGGSFEVLPPRPLPEKRRRRVSCNSRLPRKDSHISESPPFWASLLFFSFSVADRIKSFK